MATVAVSATATEMIVHDAHELKPIKFLCLHWVCCVFFFCFFTSAIRLCVPFGRRHANAKVEHGPRQGYLVESNMRSGSNSCTSLFLW